MNTNLWSSSSSSSNCYIYSDNINDTANEAERQLSALKLKFYAHPYFPLVRKLVQKCEQAAWDAENRISVDEEKIDEMINGHYKHMTKSPNRDSSLDELLIESLKIFRYQLHELKRVDEMCETFLASSLEKMKSKFTSLKTQLHLRLISDNGSDASDDDDSLPSSSESSVLSNAVESSLDRLPVFSDVSKPQELLDTSISDECFTILSKEVVESKEERSHFDNPPSTSKCISEVQELPLREVVSISSQHKSPIRFPLPAESVRFLTEWLLDNVQAPYPTEDEKRRFVQITGLTLNQVNNWFINGRRRILTPILKGDAISRRQIMIPLVGAKYTEDWLNSNDSLLSCSAGSTAAVDRSFAGQSLLSRRFPKPYNRPMIKRKTGYVRHGGRRSQRLASSSSQVTAATSTTTLVGNVPNDAGDLPQTSPVVPLNVELSSIDLLERYANEHPAANASFFPTATVNSSPLKPISSVSKQPAQQAFRTASVKFESLDDTSTQGFYSCAPSCLPNSSVESALNS